MWDFIFNTKKHQGTKYALIAMWLIFFLARIQPAQAIYTDATCLAGVTVNVQHAKSHACCEGAQRCDCDLKQGCSSKLPESDLVSSSGLPNLTNKNMVLFTDTTILLSTGRHALFENKALTHGPPVGIYLQTLNLLC